MRSHLHHRSDSKYILAMDSLASAAERRGFAFGNLKLSTISALLRAAMRESYRTLLKVLAVAGNMLACI